MAPSPAGYGSDCTNTEYSYSTCTVHLRCEEYFTQWLAIEKVIYLHFLFNLHYLITLTFIYFMYKINKC